MDFFKTVSERTQKESRDGKRGCDAISCLPSFW